MDHLEALRGLRNDLSDRSRVAKLADRHLDGGWQQMRDTYLLRLADVVDGLRIIESSRPDDLARHRNASKQLARAAERAHLSAMRASSCCNESLVPSDAGEDQFCGLLFGHLGEHQTRDVASSLSNAADELVEVTLDLVDSLYGFLQGANHSGEVEAKLKATKDVFTETWGRIPAQPHEHGRGPVRR